MSNLNFTVDIPKRIILFICASLLCIILGSVVIQVVLHGGLTTPRVRIATVFQDITYFIMPAIITAVIICRRPAEFLMINKLPKLSIVLVTIGIVLASIPMMNAIIKWNMSLELPDMFKSVEEWMKNSEQNAEKFTKILIGGYGLKSYLIALLIVSILAGFSEEIFFRGTIQRLFVTSGTNHHIAIWITAFIFSAIHLQFYGFVPRFLLGLFFGYAVVWSGNLWIGVIAHFTNNAIASYGMTIGKNTVIAIQQTVENNVVINQHNEFVADLIAPLISAIVTCGLIYLLKKISQTSCD